MIRKNFDAIILQTYRSTLLPEIPSCRQLFDLFFFHFFFLKKIIKIIPFDSSICFRIIVIASNNLDWALQYSALILQIIGFP